MEKRPIMFVRCPSKECDSCTISGSQSYIDCQRVRNTRRKNQRILFYDTVRKRIHLDNIITQHNYDAKSDFWKTLYVGQEEDILNDIEEVIDAYYVGPYLSLFYYHELDEINQYTIPVISTQLEFSLLSTIENQIRNGLRNFEVKRCGLTERIENNVALITEFLYREYPEIVASNRKRIADIAAYKTSVLHGIIPLLLDDWVEEIYLDHPDCAIYFDHRKHGRCHTNVILSDSEINRLITLLRAENNHHLDRNNPSLKTDVDFFDILLRFAVSLPPLAADGFHMEIRRAKFKPFTLYELIDNKTLSEEVAALILLAIQNRFNITITGAPGSGKTTLMNAIDMETPKDWRKIYIEDVIESRLQLKHHQIRVRVDPVDELTASNSKSMEIIKTLHRSPDYLILGEIQTAEHSQALFQAISAGIRTIQTCHSDSATSLISRWKANHNIEEDNMALMDIIIVLNRPLPGKSHRRIIEVSEIRRCNIDGINNLTGLNKLYDINETCNIVERLADDGAFLSRMRDFGIDEISRRYKFLLQSIQKRDSIMLKPAMKVS